MIVGLGSLGCLPLITITSFQQIFCTGVRGCPLESGETSPPGKTVQYVFPACYGVRHTPQGLFCRSCVAHTTTTAEPKHHRFPPEGCIASVEPLWLNYCFCFLELSQNRRFWLNRTYQERQGRFQRLPPFLPRSGRCRVLPVPKATMRLQKIRFSAPRGT